MTVINCYWAVLTYMNMLRNSANPIKNALPPLDPLKPGPYADYGVGLILLGRTCVTPQSKALTPEQQKIQELEVLIARFEREK